MVKKLSNTIQKAKNYARKNTRKIKYKGIKLQNCEKTEILRTCEKD